MSSIRKPFGYEPIVKKEDIKRSERKKAQKASNWKAVLWRIWRLIDQQRFLLIAVLVLVLASSALSLIGPLVVGTIIDDFIIPRETDGLARTIAWLLAVYAGLSLATYFQNYWMVGIAQQTVYKLRTMLFGHLQKLPVRFFDKRQHGELMSRMTNDIENVSQTLNSSLIQVFSSVLTLVGTVSIMLYLSPLLTLLTMIIVPLMFAGMRWITRRTGILFKEQQKAIGALNGMIEETVSGQRVVKAFSREQYVMEEFAEKSNRLRHAGFWAQTYSGFIPKVMNTLNNLSFAIVAGIGGWFAVAGYGGVTVGTIVIFSEYARQFTRPLNDLANQFNTVLSAVAGAERVFAILDEPEEADEASEEPRALQGDVTFRNVTFGYDEEPIVKNINFHVSKGESAAFVGATGAGKTTIMQLLARFYDADSGEILLDGTAITKLPRKTVRSQMAFVLQDAFLFETTVRENIRYGRLEASDEEVEAAAKEANAHSFICKLPDGYDTVLTAGGEEISQGQKQLLSIARALLADPVLLLLDEATSSIDTVTELAIQEALERLMKGRTSFMIAHRLNTIRKADKIFVLADGEIVESGSHEQLLAERGLFYSMQTNEQHE